VTHHIERITIPSTLDDPDAIDFIAAVHVRNTVEIAGYGIDELAFTPSEVLPRWHDPESPRQMFGTRVDGTIVARSVYEMQHDSTTAWLVVEVLPEFQSQGMGAALIDHIEQVAIADGRDNLLIYCVSSDAAGERIASPTGFGSVPADNAEVRFLLAHGYSLEQVERGSRLPLPADVPALATRLAETMPSGYRLHYWADRTPPRWQAGIAELLTRMSTDAPDAGLDEPLDEWTAERVGEHEERMAASPRSWLYAAVEHVTSESLVGFTTLSVPLELERSVSQEDTIVLSEHRGHRLGTVLKLANLLHLQKERPGHPSIITFNAEENRHMLDVNESVGFVPIGYEGAWKKVVS